MIEANERNIIVGKLVETESLVFALRQRNKYPEPAKEPMAEDETPEETPESTEEKTE